MKTLLLLIVFLPTVVAFAESSNEEWPPGSAADTYYTAERQFKDSDKKLNMIYKKLFTASYANTTAKIAKRHLVNAQKTWLKFRDSTCAMEGELRGGWPTWKHAKEMICKSEMTTQRIKDLENLFFDCCEASNPNSGMKENSNRDSDKVEVAVDNFACSSISGTDLQDSTVNKIKFADGKACSSVDPTLPDRCDWEHQISKDEILKPIPGKEVRLVVIHSNHLTGSGVMDTILVFDCLNGFMKTIFKNEYLYGAKINKKTDGELIIASGEWQSSDPMCCPSKEKWESYHWNPCKNTFVLDSATTSRSTSKQYKSK